MIALPSLKQLQHLVALAQQLNFTKAAQDCCVTQSTLSASLKELETAIGTTLVERNRQTVLMTATGREVAERARAIIAATHDLVERAAQAPQPMSGALRLGVIPTVAPFLLPAALQRLRERYPALRLALREDLTAKLLQRIADGQLDFALIALPYDTWKLLVETLFDDALLAVGRNDDALLRTTPVKATPALAERLLLLEEGHCLRDHTLYACGRPPQHGTQEFAATSLLTLVQMIDSGIGVGLIPAMAIASGLTRSQTLVARPLSPSPTRTIALVARPSTSRRRDLAAIAEVLRQTRVG